MVAEVAAATRLVNRSKDLAWPQSSKANTRTAITPITNSVSRRLPIRWPTTGCRTKTTEAQGQRVVPLRNLEPWGIAVSLFSQERHDTVLAWLETGASEKSQQWWKHVYPQLVWDLEGPLAPR